MPEVPMKCSCEPAAPGQVPHCRCERMSQHEYEQYMDGLISKSRKAAALDDGRVHAAHAAVDATVQWVMTRDECDYPTALDRVLADGDLADDHPSPQLDPDRCELDAEIRRYAFQHDCDYATALDAVADTMEL
jgi:hypothetical protein